MLILLNTFDECQTDKSLSSFCLFISVCLSVSFTHYHISFFHPHFHFGPSRLKPTDPSLFLPYELLNIHLPNVLSQDIYTTGSLYSEMWGAVRGKNGTLSHVCNDRQQSAFRVPAFIKVNVDDTCLLLS